MSMQSWMNEFYPESAQRFQDGGSDLEAVEHSIRKWEGLRPENLRRHGLTRHYMQRSISAGNGKGTFQVDSTTCHLCRLHGDKCSKCPMSKSSGGKACGGDDYGVFLRSGNPEPMLRVLQNTRDWLLGWDVVRRLDAAAGHEQQARPTTPDPVPIPADVFKLLQELAQTKGSKPLLVGDLIQTTRRWLASTGQLLAQGEDHEPQDLA